MRTTSRHAPCIAWLSAYEHWHNYMHELRHPNYSRCLKMATRTIRGGTTNESSEPDYVVKLLKLSERLSILTPGSSRIEAH